MDLCKGVSGFAAKTRLGDVDSGEPDEGRETTALGGWLEQLDRDVKVARQSGKRLTVQPGYRRLRNYRRNDSRARSHEP